MRSNRISTKQRDSEAQRRAMTERRTLLSEKIRKSRRSHAVSLKRKLNSTITNMAEAITTTSSTNISLEEIANQVIQAPTDLVKLQHLETILMQPQNRFSLFLPVDVPSAQSMVNALVEALQYPLTQLAAARILTNLAATEVPASSDDNYYGTTDMTWSLLLTQTQGFLVPTLRDAISSQSSCDELSSQCCWCLGNLAGDASCRELCLPLVPSLIYVLQQALALQQVALCRNVTWALSNLARGPSALPFLGPFLLTPALISQVLLSPERIGGGTTQADSITWSHVAYEMLWLVAFLTSREDEAVNYLCDSTTGTVSFSSQPPRLLCEAVACRLATLTDVVPCLRAVGNIATACGGKHLTGLLEAHSGSVMYSLAKLISLDDAPVLATEAAWAAGTLLCDAGRPDHLSTKVAVPILLPKLCETLTSDYSKLDVKRECLSALWNACAAYPGESMGDAWSSRSVRDDFLLQIYQTPKMLRTIVDLLETSVDTDLTLVAVQLTNALLRRLTMNTPIQDEFAELQCVDALEGICDRASQLSQYGEAWHSSEAADIAADLIDDLFSENKDEDEMQVVVPIVSGNQFAFGTLQSPEAFDFGPTGAGRGVSTKPAWLEQHERQHQEHR